MKTVYVIFFVVALHTNTQLWSKIFSKMNKKGFFGTLNSSPRNAKLSHLGIVLIYFDAHCVSNK